VRPLLQDREKAEARRLKDHAKRKAREQAAIEDNKRRLGELFLEVQRREDRLAAIDAELRAEHHNDSYRPDETDTFRDLAEERDWERSAEEYERFMGRGW
jgi:hypothetical protein